MTARAAMMRDVRAAIRSPYAWPGGYPVYVLLEDGEMLCPGCARGHYRYLSDAARRNDFNDGWKPVGTNVLWETGGGPEHCGHCHAELESAYGNVDA